MKRSANGEIRQMIEDMAVDLRGALRDKVQDMYDRIEAEMTAGLATKADASHTHTRGQVTGLNPALQALQDKNTALEARVAALEAKVP